MESLALMVSVILVSGALATIILAVASAVLWYRYRVLSIVLGVVGLSLGWPFLPANICLTLDAIFVIAFTMAACLKPWYK